MLFIVFASLFALGLVLEVTLSRKGVIYEMSGFIGTLTGLVFLASMIGGSIEAYSGGGTARIETINGEQNVCTPVTEEYSTRWLVPWGGPIQAPTGELTCVVVSG